MAKVVGDIVIDVFADVGPMVREFNRGESAMSGFGAAAQRIGTRMQAVGASASALGQRMTVMTAAVAAAAAGLGLLVSQGAAAGDKIANSARAVGLSTEAYQEYAFAIGEAAEVTQDEFDRALTLMNRRLGEAAEGSASATAAFERIGISAADIASGAVSTEEALAALVGTLEGTTDPAIAAAIASDLLGRTGAAMGSRMAGAAGQVDDLRSRARELGIVMDGDAIKAAEDYGDAVGELTSAWEATKVAIAEEVLPVFVNELIPFLTNTALPAIRDIIDAVGEWIDWFEDLPQPVKNAAGAIAIAFAAGGPALLAIGAVAGALGGIVAFLGTAGTIAVAVAATVGVFIAFGDDIKAAIGGAIDYVLAKIDQMVKGITEAIGGMTELMGLSGGGSVEDQVRRDNMIRLQREGGPGTSGTYPYSPGIGGGAGSDAQGGAGADRLGAAMVDGMLMGITGAVATNYDGFAAAFEQIPQIARDVLGIQSPSTVFAELGGYVGEGFANGIQGSAQLVGDAVRAIGATASGAAGAMSNDILSAMGILFQGSQKVGAGIALINTMIGASEELKKGTFGLVSAARVIATGMGFVKAIKSASPGGGGTASVGASGGGGGGGTAAPSQGPLQVSLSGFGANDLIRAADMGMVLDNLNRVAGDRGLQLFWPK